MLIRPAEYIQTVKEGVNYWNLVLGKDTLHSEVAPQGVTAPDPRYDIIQWVPDDSAGSAYADALTDPRTGEILHAQIYLTSTFVNGLKLQLPALQRKLKDRDNRKTHLNSAQQPALSGRPFAIIARRHFGHK